MRRHILVLRQLTYRCAGASRSRRCCCTANQEAAHGGTGGGSPSPTVPPNWRSPRRCASSQSSFPQSSPCSASTRPIWRTGSASCCTCPTGSCTAGSPACVCSPCCRTTGPHSPRRAGRADWATTANSSRSSATDLADGFSQLLHLPDRFVYGGLAGMRLFSVLQDDWAALTASRRSRGLGDDSKFKSFFPQAFALLVLSIRRSTTLAVAMQARGFGSDEPRSHARVSVVRARGRCA